jgi:membrane-bound serine protease (ClpP class)
MVLGVALIIGEAFAPSFGALGIGGIAAFVFGSIMLINTRAPGFQVAPGVIGGVAAAAAILLLLIVLLFVHARRQRVQTGAQGLIGSECVALEDFTEQGRVHLHGESWLAVTATPARRGDVLVVTATQGLKVHVRSKRADDPSFTKTT